MKILLIEDDDALIALLTRSLNSQHHVVDAVKDGEMGWTYASTFDYDLIILDIMLPKLDGISLCKRLRGDGYTMPIMLLTAQDQTNAKVQGLDAGADDYVVKPFDIVELIARLRALLRRGSTNPLPLLSWGDLLLNPSTCEVTYNGQPVILTTKEYDLLELLLRDSYHVFSSNEIIDRLWSSDAFPTEATVRSHLRRLRNKLQAAGAPHDFISTIHGRGYFIKSLQPDSSMVGQAASSQLPITDQPLLSSPSQRIVDAQQEQQYLSFLKETWVTTKPQCLQQLVDLGALIDGWHRGAGNNAEQAQAHHLAHKLAGTLGVFSLLAAMEIARELEDLLARQTLLSSVELTTLRQRLNDLKQAVTVTEPQQIMNTPSPDLPLLIFVDLESTMTASLTAMANQWGLRTLVLPTIDDAYHYLAGVPAVEVKLSSPTVVLVSLAASSNLQAAAHPLLRFIHNIHQRFTHWSVLVLSECDSLQNRLTIVRNGGKFLGTASVTTEQIFAVITDLLQVSTSVAKVMVVDDDQDWLRSLPKLLQPWGMKVTTLADPQQFLTVLQLVQPDALILDVKMPEINGLELCQVLRGDPFWQRLPILFLSATTNPMAQQEAFSAGADDYLCKPVQGGELAQRIRHRLARLQAGQAAT